jgi:hypothetical protein
MTSRFNSSLAGASIAVGLLFAVAVSGCSKPPMISATGIVTLDGKPVENCKLAFFPDVEQFNPDRHGYGFAVTDKTGKFEVQHPQGEKGIYPGTYKVTFVCWVNAKGELLPYDIKPSEVEGGVKNKFPDKYESLTGTPERATIIRGTNHFEFNIASK